VKEDAEPGNTRQRNDSSIAGVVDHPDFDVSKREPFIPLPVPVGMRATV
jgi:hypothetical protein